jgi:hypothetical protein
LEGRKTELQDDHNAAIARIDAEENWFLQDYYKLVVEWAEQQINAPDVAIDRIQQEIENLNQ